MLLLLMVRHGVWSVLFSLGGGRTQTDTGGGGGSVREATG